MGRHDLESWALRFRRSTHRLGYAPIPPVGFDVASALERHADNTEEWEEFADLDYPAQGAWAHMDEESETKRRLRCHDLAAEIVDHCERFTQAHGPRLLFQLVLCYSDKSESLHSIDIDLSTAREQRQESGDTAAGHDHLRMEDHMYNELANARQLLKASEGENARLRRRNEELSRNYHNDLGRVTREASKGMAKTFGELNEAAQTLGSWTNKLAERDAASAAASEEQFAQTFIEQQKTRRVEAIGNAVVDSVSALGALVLPVLGRVVHHDAPAPVPELVSLRASVGYIGTAAPTELLSYSLKGIENGSDPEDYRAFLVRAPAEIDDDRQLALILLENRLHHLVRSSYWRQNAELHLLHAGNVALSHLAMHAAGARRA